MVEIPLRNGEIATVGEHGIAIKGSMFQWDDLIACMYAASQVCREGSRKHDDLFQASYDYLPSLKRRAADPNPDPEDRLTFCGMERPQ